VQGSFLLEPRQGRHGFVPLYLMGRQRDDAKAWTSPLFITFKLGREWGRRGEGVLAPP
jgi:hypothetical protein